MVNGDDFIYDADKNINFKEQYRKISVLEGADGVLSQLYIIIIQELRKFQVKTIKGLEVL